jgi:hypothetical protein
MLCYELEKNTHGRALASYETEMLRRRVARRA